MKVQASAELAIPAGAIKMSLIPYYSSGFFTHHGISWFRTEPLLQGLADPEGKILATSDWLDGLLEGYDTEIREVLQNSAMLKDFDFTTEAGTAEAVQQVVTAPNKDTPEFWAILTHGWKSHLETSLASGDVAGAAFGHGRTIKLKSNANLRAESQ